MKSLVPLTLFGLLVTACHGYGEEQATQRCDIDETNNVQCFDEETRTACLDCYSECGDRCTYDNLACPVAYSCPE